MSDDVQANQSSKLEADLKSLREDFDRLREDLRVDLASVRSDFTDLTRDARSMAVTRGKQAYESLEQRIEDQPLRSTLLGLGIGFLVGYLVSHR